jgi:hypothetical protein
MAGQQPTGVVRQPFVLTDWRSLRLARGLALATVARDARINIATLSLVERGLKRLRPAAEVRLAAFFFGPGAEL